jgi:hypothetical protein
LTNSKYLLYFLKESIIVLNVSISTLRRLIMTFIQKFVLVFVSAFMFAASASADYLDNIGGGSTAAAPAKQEPAATASASLHQCTQAYGSAALDVQPVHPQYQYMFAQFGFSTQLVQPMARHTVTTSACFAVAGPNDVNTARYVLKVTVQNLSTASKASYGNLLARSLAGALVSANNKLTLTSVQVEMAVMDAKTGELVATAIGTGMNDNAGAGVALLANAPGMLGGATSQNPAAQVLAAALVDAFNKVAPFMDNAVGASLATTAVK